MILLLDNNQYRRHDVLLSLFMKKYTVAEQTIDDMDCYTKPFVTVYLNPTIQQIQKIKKEDTICVVAKNNLTIQTPSWMRVIPLDKNVAKSIIRIYEENRTFGNGREVFGILGLEGRLFTIGGAYVHLTPRQMKALKIFLYNPNKKFALYDISSYLDFNTDREYGFIKMVEDINYKCRRAGRETLIMCKNNEYFISPTVLNY
ncbi:MAG: hypothetical protein E7596_02825 [Ruminococcaceae bacterium]|nr:hypothetical protein [Oscillospiraceae bacterium]